MLKYSGQKIFEKIRIKRIFEKITVKKYLNNCQKIFEKITVKKYLKNKCQKICDRQTKKQKVYKSLKKPSQAPHVEV